MTNMEITVRTLLGVVTEKLVTDPEQLTHARECIGCPALFTCFKGPDEFLQAHGATLPESQPKEEQTRNLLDYN